MTPHELIGLLQQHPKACKVLGVTMQHFAGDALHEDEWCVYAGVHVGHDATALEWGAFRCWLVGAAADWFDTACPAPTFPDKLDSVMWVSYSFGNIVASGPFQTRLHAMLATMEAFLP